MQRHLVGVRRVLRHRAAQVDPLGPFERLEERVRGCVTSHSTYVFAPSFVHPAV